jgi:ABC-type transport system involved in cytochrome bd biosynthesis fused ATPase/permease subunit
MSESLEKFSDKALEDRIKTSLEQSARNLDVDTQNRLNALRRNALNQPTKENWLKFNGWIPATSLVFCSVIAMLILIPSHQASNNISELPDQTALLELLDNPEELDTISDPYFYLWVDEVNDENGAQHAV